MKSLRRVLVAEDFSDFREFVATTLLHNFGVTPICVRDGLEAVQKAEHLQPDLVCLDIGLPGISGIEAARQIRQVAPNSRILFISMMSSATLVEEALARVGHGYLFKIDAGAQLVEAVNSVLRNERFVSSTLARKLKTQPAESLQPLPRNRHELSFYSDDSSFGELLAGFIEAGLKAQSTVIVFATPAHSDSLLQALQRKSIDVSFAVQEGRYISIDSYRAVEQCMRNGMIDLKASMRVAEDLIRRASEISRSPDRRICVCGEVAPLLLEQGHAKAAILVEELWDGITKCHNVDLLCCYRSGSFHPSNDSQVLQQVCAHHSAVYGDVHSA